GTFGTAYKGNSDAFVAKFDPASGTALGSLLISKYIGGGSLDYGYGIAVDGSAQAYVTGYTTSSNFPTVVGSFDTTYNGAGDAYVLKLNSTLDALIYSTYLGGTGTDIASSIALDAGDEAYVAGRTSSGKFPTTPGAISTKLKGGRDGFVTKLNAAGTT